jgi:hypothetical protein
MLEPIGGTDGGNLHHSYNQFQIIRRGCVNGPKQTPENRRFLLNNLRTQPSLPAFHPPLFCKQKYFGRRHDT